MASILARPATRTILTAATLGSIGTFYLYHNTRPLLLDSANNDPRKTLAFPKSMLFSRQLRVTNVEQINHDTKRVTFALPGGDAEISGVPPGGAILTQHTPKGRWFPVLRPYSPVHDLDERGVLQLVVKKYEKGLASGYIHSLQPGDELTVRGPIPSYSWTPLTTPRDLLLIAGGAGITPIFSLTKGVLNHAEDKSRVHILWGVNGTRDIVLKKELEALEQKYPDRLKVTYFVSGPEGKPEAPTLGDETKYKKGYINKTALQNAIEQVSQKGAWGDAKGTKVFFCGPPTMQEGIAGKKGILRELGIEKKAVHVF